MSDEPTPFDHWWAIYDTPRKVAKAQCREKFNAHDIDTQRHIYKHTKWCLTNHPDWRIEGGVRQYVSAPVVYLNQRRWEDWSEDAPKASDRFAPKEAWDSDEAQLKALQRLADAAGDDGGKLADQIQQLRDKMGAKIL